MGAPKTLVVIDELKLEILRVRELNDVLNEQLSRARRLNYIQGMECERMWSNLSDFNLSEFFDENSGDNWEVAGSFEDNIYSDIYSEGLADASCFECHNNEKTVGNVIHENDLEREIPDQVCFLNQIKSDDS